MFFEVCSLVKSPNRRERTVVVKKAATISFALPSWYQIFITLIYRQ